MSDEEKEVTRVMSREQFSIFHISFSTFHFRDAAHVSDHSPSFFPHHSSLIFSFLIQFPLHSPQPDYRLLKPRLLLQRQAVVPRRFQIAVAHFIDAAQVKVRKTV